MGHPSPFIMSHSSGSSFKSLLLMSGIWSLLTHSFGRQNILGLVICFLTETINYSFISRLLFFGNRSFGWVQSSPPKTTSSCFPCSLDVACVTRSWPMRWQGRIAPFHLSVYHWLEYKCDGRNWSSHFGSRGESCTWRKTERQD